MSMEEFKPVEKEVSNARKKAREIRHELKNLERKLESLSHALEDIDLIKLEESVS